jgi:hypothetical protein
MTKRKTDAADDSRERAEREAIAWIKATPTEDWVMMVRIWPRWLPKLSATAQRRILRTMLEVAITRCARVRRRARERARKQMARNRRLQRPAVLEVRHGRPRRLALESWPAELVESFARQVILHLAVSEQPRSRIHNKEAFRKAAEYVAHHPKASDAGSWNALADAAGVSQSTVRQWAQFPDFARYEADARFNIRQEKLRVWGRWLGEQIKKSHRR